MKIAISSLPKKPWWSDGIIGYKDNPFMKNGTVPNQNLLIKERLNLIATLKKNKIEVIEFPFPKILEESKFGHDYVFMRDSFISDLNGNVLMLKFAEKKREAETEIVANELEKLNFNLKELPTKKNILAEGGEFYYCSGQKILFSGACRNNIRGAEWVAQEFNVNELVILKSNVFHLDTLFTPVIDKKNKLRGVVACTELMEKDSKIQLKDFTNRFGIDLVEVDVEDSIGTDQALGEFAVNCCPLPGYLIGPTRFRSLEVNQLLSKLDVMHITVPTTQFRLSGGSVHCLTNEL